MARGRVKVDLHGVPEWLPALAPFAADRFPWFESRAAQRSYCQERLTNDTHELYGFIIGLVTGFDSKTLGRYGFRWQAGARESIVEFAEQFAGELRERILSAPIESAAKPTLRLVSCGAPTAQ